MKNLTEKQIRYQGQILAVKILRRQKQNGRHFEVNITGYPRFYLRWSAANRFDLTESNNGLPEELILLVSDLMETEKFS